MAEVPEGGDEGVDVFAGVVESERWADGAFDAEAAEDGLGAVVAGADGDALAVEGGADVFGAEAVEDEGEDAGFFAGGADEAEAGDAEEFFGGVDEQVVFVARDVDHADAAE